MSQPTFAVVVPVHNKERHAARALRSIQGQTLSPAEIIVIDDASTDGSMAAMRAVDGGGTIWLRRDEPGPGGYAARNLGIETATAEWIAFLDADDSWEPGHLAALAEAIGRAGPDVACAFSSYRIVQADGARDPDWYGRTGKTAGEFGAVAMLDHWLAGGSPLWTGVVAIRRDLFATVGMFPAGLARRGGDRDLWLRTLLATPCAYTGQVTATYHRDSDNMVTKGESLAVRQRIQDTILAQLPAAAPAVAERLRRLFNRETFRYAFGAWKGGAPISAATVAGFSARTSPGRWMLLQAMRRVPMPLSQGARGRVRGMLARLRGRVKDGSGQDGAGVRHAG